MILNLRDIHYLVMSIGIKSVGTYNPKEVMPYIFESLTKEDYDSIELFLSWVHKNGKSFGSGNYNEVYQDFLLEFLR